MARVLFYTAGKTGLGQAVRLTRVANSLGAFSTGKHRVTLISGIPHIGDICPSNAVQHIQLDELAQLTYWGRMGGKEHPSELHLKWMLEQRLSQIIHEQAPTVFLTSHYRGICGELLMQYEFLRKTGCRIVLGLRDIYDYTTDLDIWPSLEEFHETLEAWFDAVVIFGTRKTAKWLPMKAIPDRLRDGCEFLGYIAPVVHNWSCGPQLHRDLSSGGGESKHHRVLCQVGGGFDGTFVAEAAIEALKLLRSEGWGDVQLTVISGPFMSEIHKNTLKNLIEPPDMELQNMYFDAGKTLGGYCAQVSMGGYNTCVEAVCSSIPTVLMPRPGSDVEQTVRAEFFSDRFSNMHMLRSNSLTDTQSELSDLLKGLLGREKIVCPNSRPGNFFANDRALTKTILALPE